MGSAFADSIPYFSVTDSTTPNSGMEIVFDSFTPSSSAASFGIFWDFGDDGFDATDLIEVFGASDSVDDAQSVFWGDGINDGKIIFKSQRC